MNSHSTRLQPLRAVIPTALVLAAMALAAGPVGLATAEEGAPAPAPAEEIDARPETVSDPEADPVPEVGLDKLLRLPNSFEADIDRRGGATATEWRLRFGKARDDVEEAEKKLTKAEEELGRISGSSTSWQVSAPGASDPQTSPLSLRLRQEIKAHRVEIKEAERELRSLDVAADLAAVPTEWRE